MLEHKKFKSLTALIGACALFMSVPAISQAATTAKPVAAAASSAKSAASSASSAVSGAASSATSAASEAAADASAPPAAPKHKITLQSMFTDAHPVVKAVMLLLIFCSVGSWFLVIVKVFENGSRNRVTNNFLEAFRGARSIADINRISTSDEFAGNPMADMAAVATEEVQLSKQAGLSVSGEHRDSTLTRAGSAINAVQASLNKRLSGGQTFLASVGSTGPFVGLFGTVFGIMNSFIGIAESNTTNLAVVAPGIAEALLATGLGLIAAIPAVSIFNVFNAGIAAYGSRSEQFVAELQNTLSRQLDKGA